MLFTLQKKWHVCWKSFKAIGFGQSSSSTYRQMELVHEELFTNMDLTEASTYKEICCMYSTYRHYNKKEELVIYQKVSLKELLHLYRNNKRTWW